MESTLPRVIITTTASVDGRIALSKDSLLLQPETARRWAVMKPPNTDEVLGARRDEYGSHVTLEGSGSFIDDNADPITLPGPVLPEQHLQEDFLPRRTPQWFVVADSRGRVDWTFTGDETTALLILVCEATPLGYLQMLHDRKIGYLFAGEGHVDLEIALRRVASVLDAATVVADSGGTINAALLRAGLVDEIDIVTLPGLVGGVGTPSIMDGSPLTSSEVPIRLELISCNVHELGFVRTRYRVVNTTGPKAT